MHVVVVGWGMAPLPSLPVLAPRGGCDGVEGTEIHSPVLAPWVNLGFLLWEWGSGPSWSRGTALSEEDQQLREPGICSPGCVWLVGGRVVSEGVLRPVTRTEHSVPGFFVSDWIRSNVWDLFAHSMGDILGTAGDQ